MKLASLFIGLSIASSMATEVTIVAEQNHTQCVQERSINIAAALAGKSNIIQESVISSPSNAISEADYAKELQTFLSSYGIPSTTSQLSHIRGLEDAYLNHLTSVLKLSEMIFFTLEAAVINNPEGTFYAVQVNNLNKIMTYIRDTIDIDPIFTLAINKTLSGIESTDKAKAKVYFQALEEKDMVVKDVWNKVAGIFNKCLMEFPQNMHAVLLTVFGNTYAIDSLETKKSDAYADLVVQKNTDFQQMIAYDERVKGFATRSKKSFYLYSLYLRDQFISTHVINNIRYFAGTYPSLPIVVHLGESHMKYLKNALAQTQLKDVTIKYTTCGELNPMAATTPDHDVSARTVRLNPTLEVSSYQVYDLQGKVVLSGKTSTPAAVEGPEGLMKTKGLAPGVYLINYKVKKYDLEMSVKTVITK